MDQSACSSGSIFQRLLKCLSVLSVQNGTEWIAQEMPDIMHISIRCH